MTARLNRNLAAQHSHMLDEEPRLFFMHFWANDDAAKLAKGLRAGLDTNCHARSKVRSCYFFSLGGGVWGALSLLRAHIPPDSPPPQQSPFFIMSAFLSLFLSIVPLQQAAPDPQQPALAGSFGFSAVAVVEV
jgi:hypothetical protein